LVTYQNPESTKRSMKKVDPRWNFEEPSPLKNEKAITRLTDSEQRKISVSGAYRHFCACVASFPSNLQKQLRSVSPTQNRISRLG
jgi:hypothetical protein